MGVGALATVAGVLLAVPVTSSGSGTPPMSLDASSSAAAGDTGGSAPPVTGQDGGPAPSATTDAVAVAASAPPQPPVKTETSEVAPEPAADAPGTVAPAAPVLLAGAAAPGAVPPGAEAEVLALVNTARAGSGCDPLVQDEGLAAVARAHSADMRDRSFFDHVNPSGLDPFDRARAAGQTNARAENIAYGQPGPAAVMAHWMGSSTHRANILDCSLRTLGVGAAEGPAGPWWTQLFGD